MTSAINTHTTLSVPVVGENMKNGLIQLVRGDRAEVQLYTESPGHHPGGVAGLVPKQRQADHRHAVVQGLVHTVRPGVSDEGSGLRVAYR